MISILYIDDDSEEFEFFMQALSDVRLQIQCTLVQDPSKAIDTLRTLMPRPDIIFLDRNMPKISGDHLLKQLKSDKEFNDIPVIIYSSSITEEDEHNLKRAGAHATVSKKSDLRELARQITSQLEIIQER